MYNNEIGYKNTDLCKKKKKIELIFKNWHNVFVLL